LTKGFGWPVGMGKFAGPLGLVFGRSRFGFFSFLSGLIAECTFLPIAMVGSFSNWWLSLWFRLARLT